jgi:hypothetical protein
METDYDVFIARVAPAAWTPRTYIDAKVVRCLPACVLIHIHDPPSHLSLSPPLPTHALALVPDPVFLLWGTFPRPILGRQYATALLVAFAVRHRRGCQGGRGRLVKGGAAAATAAARGSCWLPRTLDNDKGGGDEGGGGVGYCYGGYAKHDDQKQQQQQQPGPPHFLASFSSVLFF